jgi:hypothetical protein
MGLLAACASMPPPTLAEPTPFSGAVQDIASSIGPGVRAYLLFDEVYPNGETVFHGASPAATHRAEGAWMWDIASMTVDALKKSGIEIVDNPADADVEIVYELVSTTPGRFRPVGYRAPDDGTAVKNFVANVVSLGGISNDMITYVDAEYRATIRTPSGERQFAVPMSASAPFRQADWRDGWRKEAFALAREMYIPEFNTAVAAMMAQLKPTLEEAIIR